MINEMPEESPAERDEPRQRILRAAVEVFLEKGYGGARVADIADRAGYTGGALYVHFPGRTALLAEAIVMEGRRLIADLLTELGAVPVGEGVAEALAAQMCRPGSTLDRLIVEALALAARDPEAKSLLDASFAELVAMVGDQLDDAREAGFIDPALDADALRAVFTSWIFGLVVIRALGVQQPEASATADIVRRMTVGLSPT